MKYFEMLEDSRILYKYEINEVEWQTIGEETIGTAYFKGKKENLPDFIFYKKQFLVSLELKNVLEMYTDDVRFKFIIFNNIEAQSQKEFYSVESPLIEGLGNSTTYNKDNTVKDRVLSYKKLQDYKVFGLKELELTKFSRPHIFVHLDVVESALRRGLWGINFDEMLVED